MNGSVCVCFLWLSVLNILRLFYLRSNPFLSISDSKFRSTPVPGSTVENVTYLNTVFILYYFYSSHSFITNLLFGAGNNSYITFKYIDMFSGPDKILFFFPIQFLGEICCNREVHSQNIFGTTR